MRAHHWIMVGLVLIAGYFLGAKYPALAARAGVSAA